MRYIPAFALLAAILFCGLCIQPVLAESADEWVNSGNQFNQQGRCQEALQAFENAINLDSKNKYAWTGKCGALLGLGRYDDALSAADFAQTLDQSDPSFNEIVFQIKGNALKSLNRNQEALDAFDKALAINANNGFTWILKSDTLNQMGRSAEALQSAEKALEIDPTRAEAWNSKGSALQSLNRPQESLDAYNKALEIDSGNQWIWSGKSNVLNQMGRYAEALTAAEKALAIDPTNANFWNSKGNALLSLGGYQESLDAFNAGLALDANNQNSQNGRQEALNKIGTGPGSTITVTPVPTPLLVTAVSTPGLERNPPLSSPSNSGASNLTSAAAADTMFRANPEHTGVYDNGGIVTTNTELWRFVTGGYSSSDPTVSNGVVYIGSDVKNLWAIDAVTGTEKWRFAMGNSVSSSPAVSNGIVYVGSSDKNLYAIDAVTGKEKWRFVTGGYISSSPAVSNGVVYVGSWDKNLYAIDAITGMEKWRFAMGNSVSSSPAVSNGVVYIGSYKNLYAIDAVTGVEKWRFEMGSWWSSSPAVSNGVVYVGNQDKNLYAIDAVTGVEKWRFEMGNSVSSSPAVSNGVVYVGSWDKNLYAIDAVTGMEKWRFEMGSWWSSSPAVSNGVVYVGSQDTNLYAIDVVTGTEKWRFETGGSGFYMPSSPSVSNGVVYVWSNKNLWAIGDAPTSQLNTQSPSSIQTVATNQAAVTTAVPSLGIQNTLSSSSPSNSIYPNFSLPIIVILVVLFLAGGGYTIYRMKKKPSDYQPPKRKEKKVIAPHPQPTGSTTKPELTLTLDRTRLVADDWDRMTIQLVNRGNAHARDVRLTFSNEFDTKWIKPAMINAGATTSLDIGIRPKVKGKIPLEVTAIYHDVYDKEYRETHEFWIDVVEKDTTTSPPSETPSSPVSQFTPRPLTPKQLPTDLSDRYTESEFIGKGGFARVFKAKRKDGKYVAVKIPISLDAMTGKSFIAEMQNWTRLSHPNIVRLYDFNIMPMPFFEEELCDSTLSDQEKPLESEKAAWILFNICEGLKFAHIQKIIHRDLKPQNILLKNGVPKISDWGLSRIISESTTTTSTSFTPHYAAPEQINNRVKDERTDIWQLGVILYELVTGMLPFNGDSMVEIGMNIATKDPKRPGEIQPDAQAMDIVVMKCLQKDPAKRYQSVLELQKDLAMYLRRNYTELLKISVTAHDNNQSACYCGDLVMVNLLTGDMKSAYKYLLDLVQYSRGDVKVQAQELSEQLKMRMEMGVTEIPDELIQKAEFIVHQVSVGFRKRG